MKNRKRILFAIIFFLSAGPSALGQEKLLTIDDIFDPAKRVNFNGTPANPRWLKDGVHYMVVSRDRNASPRLLKVDAVTGKSQPLYDAARMEAAFASLPGINKDEAHRLANQTSYQLNPSETGVMINFANDLFYYEFGSERAIRLTSNPEEELGEAFSPDGRMVSFIRGNNLYVEDLSMQRRERALTRDGNESLLNGRLDWVYQEELYGRGNFGAYWWSPDSTRIAFLRLDERPVPAFPVVDRWQNLAALAQRIHGDSAPDALALLAPDETTIAMLDRGLRTRFTILTTDSDTGQQVVSNWFNTHGLRARVLVLLPGHAPGELTRLLERIHHTPSPGDGIAGMLAAHGAASIVRRYELPQGRRYALLGPPTRGTEVTPFGPRVKSAAGDF